MDSIFSKYPFWIMRGHCQKASLKFSSLYVQDVDTLEGGNWA